VRMEDMPEHSISEMRTTSITYDADLPSDIFTPEALPDLAANPIWRKTDTQ
jgi:hypothetical protein